jgi:hypothetical protein
MTTAEQMNFFAELFPSPPARRATPLPKLSPPPAKEPRHDVPDIRYYSTEELAHITGFSTRCVVKWRHKMVGAQQVGRLWRFDKAIIDKRIATKKDIRLGF